MHSPLQNIDTKEIELPDTVFVRDIESRVFQSIVVQCLAKVQGVALLEGNFIDNLLGRDPAEGVRGIYVEQDLKSHSVNVKMEINVAYGVCIPQKAEEIQLKVAEEISRFTGLHVGCVHVVFKNLISARNASLGEEKGLSRPSLGTFAEDRIKEFSDEF